VVTDQALVLPDSNPSTKRGLVLHS
jgi:hypothetical protein